MAYTLSVDYKEDETAIARIAKAMGHPARIAILRYLASLDTCCFGDINKELPIAKATVSQHLAELKDAGLIRGTIEPPKVNYCIDQENWEKAKKMLGFFFDNDCCNNPKPKSLVDDGISKNVLYSNNEEREIKIDSQTKSKYWIVKGEKMMFTHFEVLPGSNFKSHSHGSEQITYVLDGELIFESNKKIYHLKKGDSIVIPSNVEHRVWTNETGAVAIDSWAPPNENY